MMKALVEIHRNFLDAYSRLSPQEQARVRTTLDQLLGSGTAKGLRFHKVGEFVSLSASMDLRVISWQHEGKHTLVHVDHHDAAYRWATNHSPLAGAHSALLGVVDAPLAAVAEAQIATRPEFRLLPHAVAAVLESTSDDDQMLEFLTHLPPEVQEQALAALAGEPPRDASIGSSNVAVIGDDDALRFALALPTQAWRVFLHPRQRYLVDMPVGRHIIVRGGPGTGKTVVLVHRFARLLRDAHARGGLPPRLVALTAASRDVLLEGIESLGVRDAGEHVMSTYELPRGRTALRAALDQWSSVLVDEAQDLPREHVAALLDLLDSGVTLPQHVLAFDGNQAIVHPTVDALTRFARHADTITLTYSYRSTEQIVAASRRLVGRLHAQYEGKDFQHAHEIGAMRDESSTDFVAALAGPEVMVRLTDEVGLGSALEESLTQLTHDYHADDLAVIVVGDGLDSAMGRRIEKVAPACAVLSPKESKGREFLAGIVVDALRETRVDPSGAGVTRAHYRSLIGLYVALTRFRDRVDCITLSAFSPLTMESGP
jgi:hypothetical protein